MHMQAPFAASCRISSPCKIFVWSADPRPFIAFHAIGARCLFERQRCSDTQLIVELQRLVGPHPRYGQKVQNAGRNFLTHGIKAGMGAGRWSLVMISAMASPTPGISRRRS